MNRPAGCFLVPGHTPMPRQVEAFERQFLIPNQRDEKMPVEHTFLRGLYARTIRMPTGTMATGRVHKFQALNVLLSGSVSVMTEAGIKRLEAPLVWVGEPGVKRLLYTHSDVVWMTVHASAETDPDRVVDQLTAATYEEFLDFQRARLT